MVSSLTRLLAASLALLVAAHAAPAKEPADRKTSANTLKTTATVRRWMKSMTLRDEIAQLIFISFHGAAPNARSREYRNFLHQIQGNHVGGLILVNWSNGRVIQKAEPYAVAAFLNRMQRIAKVPLLVSGDFERGVSMRVEGTTVFPHAMAFGAAANPEYSRYEGEVTARESRALGVQWIFYPVADVNNNPDNPIINIRSFGEDPEAVAEQVRAFIEGAHADKKNYALTTVKHFPGHGDTATDTHMNMATITGDRDRLNRVELVPFRAGIAAGVDAVMTAHLAVPALAPPDVPATLSRAILTDLLKSDLGFRGLVVTDALEMGGIVRNFSTGEAGVRALEAGADVLLMPTDPDAVIKAVMEAVQSGRLTRRRVQESVAKILAAKEKVGLNRNRLVDLEAIGDLVDAPEANEKAQEIADHAVTLVRNQGDVVPLAAPEKTCFVVMSENRAGSEGQVFTREVRRRVPRASVATLDPSFSRGDIEEAAGRLGGCATYAVAAFASVGAYRGTVGMLGGELPHALESLIATGKPVILAALGNPYVLRNFPTVSAYLATFSTVPPSEVSAVRALFGEIDIQGHLPVTIPGEAKYGEGIQLKAAHPLRITSSETER